MRITSTSYTPVDVLAELVSSVGILAKDTESLFASSGLDHPELVALLRDKLDVILESFRRYGSSVAETQYIRDHGVDVRLTFQTKEGDERRIGFQIKSNNEASKDLARRRAKARDQETLVGTLKRQAFEADRMGGVHEWWVFCCFDLGVHRELVSAINAEIGSGQQSRVKIRVVDPREAFAFLGKDDVEIDTLCTLLLCEEDEILVRARTDCRQLTKDGKRVVLSTLGPALEGHRSVSLDELVELVAAEDIEAAAEVLGLLERAGYLEQESGGSSFEISPAEFPGLCALYFEGRVRHKYDSNEASDFLNRMMRKS